MDSDYRNITDSQIEAFIPYLEGHIRARYAGFHETGELYAAGLEGVAEGIRRYDPAKGTPYTYWVQRYAAGYIRNRYSELTRPPIADRADLDPDEIPDESPDPLDELSDRQQAHLALAALNTEQRAVIGAIYYEGLSIRAAAQRLGLKPHTVFRTHRQALETMRQALGVQL